MAFNINQFRATLDSYDGFAKPSNFEVLITKPETVVRELKVDELRFFCEQCTVPGFQYGIETIYHDGIGYPESRPNSYQVNPVNLTFITDQKSLVYQFFYEWLKQISKFDAERERIGNSLENYLFELPETYTLNDMLIFQYNNVGEKIREFKLLYPYPKTINSFDLNWSSGSEALRITIEIEYRRWISKYANQIQN